MRESSTHRFLFESGSARETHALGKAIGRRIDSGGCIALVGALGAGKTVFTGGLCAGLDVDEEVVSPTFVLFEEFAGRIPLVHVDLYRLEHEREIEELGIFDLLGTRRVMVVEWGDRSEYLFNAAEIVIEIGVAGEWTRRIDVSCRSGYEHWFEGVEAGS